MVLCRLEWHPNVDLKRPSSSCQEECRELVDLLVIFNDWCQPLGCCVLAKGSEVLLGRFSGTKLGLSFLSSTASRPAVIALENSIMFCARIYTWMSCSMSVTFLRTDCSGALVWAAARCRSSTSLAADRSVASIACRW